MAKFGHLAGITFSGLGVAVAVAQLVIKPGVDTGESIVLLILSLGFLVLTILVARNEWILNDKGVWERLKRAIEKDNAKIAARCIREVTKEGTLTPACKDSIADHLLMALRKERRAVATAMLQAGAARPEVLTPPHFLAPGVLEACVQEGNLSAVRLLLEHGAPPDAGTHYPPLLSAMARDRQDIAELLLAHGAAPQGASPDFNPDRVTALHLLCSYRWQKEAAAAIRTATRLLQEGADINARSSSGFTPLDAAMDSRFSTGTALPELLDFLRARGAERGALLSVTQASYHACVLMKGEPHELPVTSHGCELSRAENTAEGAAPHVWQVQLSCQAAEGELPLAAAHRLACAVQELCRREEAVAADLGAGYTPAAELAAAEHPLLCMLRLHSCTTENQTGLETEGMTGFGLPELRAVDSSGAPRNWLIFAISHVLDSFHRQNACPVIETYFPIGDMEDYDLWSADEVFTVIPRQNGKGTCLEITHHVY